MKIMRIWFASSPNSYMVLKWHRVVGINNLIPSFLACVIIDEKVIMVPIFM